MDKEMISSEYVNLNLKASNDRTAIIEMAQLLYDKGIINSISVFEKDVFKREETLPTEMDWGISMPHARSAAVQTPCVAFGRSREGFYWKSESQEKTYMVFMFAVPETDTNDTHLKLISSVACALLEEDFRDACLTATTNEQITSILSQAILTAQD